MFSKEHSIQLTLNNGYESPLKFCEERQRWLQEQTVLRLQVEALQAERNMAEQDLAAFYDLHVKATRAQTCHMLQVSGDRWQALSWYQGWLADRYL